MQEHTTSPVPKRPLGKTGCQVTIYGLGGALIERGLDIRQLLPYVLSYPISTAIVGISDLAHLEENVRIASAFEPLSEQEMARIGALAQNRPG